MPVLTAALISPDGSLDPLEGEFKSDPASIAALGHAVHAAGNELALRTGTGAVGSTTLRGEKTCLTLLPVKEGILVLEHEPEAALEALKARGLALLHRDEASAAAGGLSSPPSFSGTLSLEDALHATAP